MWKESDHSYPGKFCQWLTKLTGHVVRRELGWQNAAEAVVLNGDIAIQEGRTFNEKWR